MAVTIVGPESLGNGSVQAEQSTLIEVVMLQRDGIYGAGDSYGFPPDMAAKLVALGRGRLKHEKDYPVIDRFLPDHAKIKPVVEKVSEPIPHPEKPSEDLAEDTGLFSKKKKRG